MKFRINGIKMKEAIENVLLKGKWNQGTSSKNTSLQTTMILSVSKENSYLYNGNHSTFVRRTIECEVELGGRITIDTDIIMKYLSNEIIQFTLKDNILELHSGNKLTKIPVMERHEHNDAIEYCIKNYTVIRDLNEPVIISEKTKLNTRIKVSSEELSNAINSCESVGNSIFKLDYDGENLIISSNEDNESVCITLEPIESIGPKATMEFSVPFHKYVKGPATILSYNDESPLSVFDRDFTLLRAPRVEL
jgi:hypothetical protein